MRMRLSIIGLALGAFLLPSSPGSARAQEEKKDVPPAEAAPQPPPAPGAGAPGAQAAPDAPRQPGAGENPLLRDAPPRVRRDRAVDRDDEDRVAAPAVAPPDAIYPPYLYVYPYYPWFTLPQTRPTRSYPPSITHEPRLGLQHTYRHALQMGIRVPHDVGVIDAWPRLGGFSGVVAEAKAEARREAEASGEGDEVIGLMKEGKTREAGAILADRFRESDDPRDMLLLTEVFFALGKYAPAQRLLRQALDAEDVVEALPADISRHFPKPEDFEARVQDLVSAGQFPLLEGYMLVHSKSPDQGLERLEQLSTKGTEETAPSPDARRAEILYRQYLGKAFK